MSRLVGANSGSAAIVIRQSLSFAKSVDSLQPEIVTIFTTLEMAFPLHVPLGVLPVKGEWSAHSEKQNHSVVDRAKTLPLYLESAEGKRLDCVLLG